MKTRKYTGKSKRRPVSTAFIKEDNHDSAICSYCYDRFNEIEIYLKPYFNERGIRDEHFLTCPNCAAIFDKDLMKHAGKVQPLGTVGKREVIFTAVNTRRNRRRSARKDEVYEVPELSPGIPDKELDFLLKDRPGIVTNLVDEPLNEVDEDNVVIVERFY